MTLPANFKFKSTEDPKIIEQLYTLCGTEWGGKLTPEQFGSAQAKGNFKYVDEGGRILSYYIEDANTGTIVATTSVKFCKAFYKPADRSSAISSIPDPSLFGVNNATALLISFVFTHKDYRKLGLAGQCVSKAIEATEKLIIKEKVDSSDESVADNFKKMSIADGTNETDLQLANYYLSKEYIWILYSGVNTYYERFGFKSFPMDFYEVPNTLLTNDVESAIENLIKESKEEKQLPSGKSIRLLLGDNPADQEIIQFILQNKELNIVTEINKLQFHLNLQSDRKSSTSLTNMTNILSMSKLGSSTGLSSVAETNAAAASSSSPGSPGVRRKSSVHHQTIPKFAIKPTYAHYQSNATVNKEMFDYFSEVSQKFANIQGAIVTNEVQQRSYYALWCPLKGQFFITGMGEIQFQGIPSSLPANRPRRASSLSGINELGGYNFKDLEVLVFTALHVAKNLDTHFDKVHISVNDLPEEIPDPVMYDFFINYLPASIQESEGVKEEAKAEVKLLTDAAHSIRVLPMVRKFGSQKSEFDLDWVADGMWCWG